MMVGWTLPQSLNIAGADWKIHADYRDILGILSQLNNREEPAYIGTEVALALFYENYYSMPEETHQEAWKKLCWFINGGEEETAESLPKRIDWEQDQSLIVADVNKVAGQEIRSLRFCHWWTFLSWFRGIGEGQLSIVVGIREKRRKGKTLDPWERDFYWENREKVDFKTQLTDEEEETLNLWLGEGG